MSGNCQIECRAHFIKFAGRLHLKWCVCAAWRFSLLDQYAERLPVVDSWWQSTIVIFANFLMMKGITWSEPFILLVFSILPRWNANFVGGKIWVWSKLLTISSFYLLLSGRFIIVLPAICAVLGRDLVSTSSIAWLAIVAWGWSYWITNVGRRA